MGRVVRSSSSKASLVGLVLLAGCARSAPDLPATTTTPSPVAALPPDRLERCAKLDGEIATRRHEADEIDEVLQGKRHKEQVEGFLAVLLFSPLILAGDQHTAQKKALDDRQREIDERLAEEKVLQCPPHVMESSGSH